jgi:ABC-2 type transport system permease protein
MSDTKREERAPASSGTNAVANSANGATANGVIHDIGYQRYTGSRLGRLYAARSLATHGLRTAYGLGRSAGGKAFPWGVFGLIIMVAAILTAIRSQTGQMVSTYWEFPISGVSLLVTLFCAVAAPELVSRDLRSGVLPLYFSRPLTRSDYALAKWAALVSAIFLLLLAPLLVMFLGGAFSLDGMGAVWDEFVEFSKGLAIVGVVSVLYGSISLLIASFSGRRAVSAALIVAVFLITTPVFGLMQALAYEDAVDGVPPTEGLLHLSQLAGLVSPTTMTDGVAAWWFQESPTRVGDFGPLYGGVVLGVVALCLLLLMTRYRRVAR